MLVMDLKQCPFCGGDAGYRHRWSKKGNCWFVFVECSVCGTKTKPQFLNNADLLSSRKMSEEAAIRCDRVANLWNTRLR